jgi:hypothetical protein
VGLQVFDCKREVCRMFQEDESCVVELVLLECVDGD